MRQKANPALAAAESATRQKASRSALDRVWRLFESYRQPPSSIGSTKMDGKELPTLPPPATRPVSTAASLIAGSAGGMCQVIAGNPLDVLKTRAQLAAPGQYKGTLDIALQTFRNEGILAFYKGAQCSLLLLSSGHADLLQVQA